MEVAVDIKQSSWRLGRTKQMLKALYIAASFTELEIWFKLIESPLLFALLSAWPRNHYLHTAGLPEAPEEVPAFLLLLFLLWEENLSNCRFHHSDYNHSGRLLVFGTAETNSLFEKTLEFFVAASRKQLVLLQRLQCEMFLLNSWLQLMLATAAKSYSASKASCWRHSLY